MRQRGTAGERRREGAEKPRLSSHPAAVASVLSLHATIGNRAVERMFVQRMFDETDLKGTSTGKKIWDRYTPDKDTGVTLTDHLAAKCGGGRIDTGVLAAATGANAVVYKKIAAFLSDVLNNMAGNSFAGSTVIHKNEQSKYPVDPRPERYAEFGLKGLENTRIVYDRAGQVCWISTHYESPKLLLLAGANPAAAMAHMEGYLTDNGWDPLAPLPAAAAAVPAAVAAAPAAAPAAAAPAQQAAGRGRARKQNQAPPKGGGGGAKPGAKQGKKKK